MSVYEADDTIPFINLYIQGKLFKLQAYAESQNIDINPEAEFWGHCSKLQSWVESGYDLRLIQTNLGLTLLMRLADVGDQRALIVLKEEIARRFVAGSPTNQINIFTQYSKYFNDEDITFLLPRSPKNFAYSFSEKKYY